MPFSFEQIKAKLDEKLDELKTKRREAGGEKKPFLQSTWGGVTLATGITLGIGGGGSAVKKFLDHNNRREKYTSGSNTENIDTANIATNTPGHIEPGNTNMTARREEAQATNVVPQKPSTPSLEERAATAREELTKYRESIAKKAKVEPEKRAKDAEEKLKEKEKEVADLKAKIEAEMATRSDLSNQLARMKYEKENPPKPLLPDISKMSRAEFETYMREKLRRRDEIRMKGEKPQPWEKITGEEQLRWNNPEQR